MKTIYARLGDLQLGETLEDGTTLGSVSSALENVGVEVLTTTGELRNMGDVIEDLMDKWGTLDTGTQQALAIKLAGKYQYNNLTALLENADMYNEALETSENSLGTIDEQNEIYLDSLSAKLQAMQAAFEGFVNSIFNVDDIKPFIEAVTGLINVLTDFNTSVGGGSVLLGGIGTLLRAGKNSIGETAANVYSNVISSQDAKASKEQNVSTFLNQISDKERDKLESLGKNSKTYQALQSLGSYSDIFSEKQLKEVRTTLSAIAETENQLIKTQEKLSPQIEAVNALWKKTQKTNEDLLEVENGHVKGLDKYKAKIKLIEQDWSDLQDQLKEKIGLSDNSDLSYLLDAIEGQIGAAKSAAIDKTGRKKASSSSESLTDGWIGAETVVSQAENIKDALNGIDQLKGVFDEDINAFSEAWSNYSKKIQEALTAQATAGEDSAEATKAFGEVKLALDGTTESTERFNKVLEILQAFLAGNAESVEKLGDDTEDLAERTEQLGEAGKKAENSFSFQKKVTEITNVIGAVNQLASAFMSLNNLSDIFSDEDASVFEKFLSVVENLSFSLPMLFTGLKQVWTGVEALKDVFTAATTAEVAATAATKGFSLELKKLIVENGPILLISIALTAVATVIEGIKSAIESAEQQAEKAKEKYEELVETTEKAKEAQENVEELYKSYEKTGELSDDLTDGIKDWAEALDVPLNKQDLWNDKIDDTIKKLEKAQKKLYDEQATSAEKAYETAAQDYMKENTWDKLDDKTSTNNTDKKNDFDLVSKAFKNKQWGVFCGSSADDLGILVSLADYNASKDNNDLDVSSDLVQAHVKSDGTAELYFGNAADDSQENAIAAYQQVQKFKEDFGALFLDDTATQLTNDASDELDSYLVGRGYDTNSDEFKEEKEKIIKYWQDMYNSATKLIQNASSAMTSELDNLVEGNLFGSSAPSLKEGNNSFTDSNGTQSILSLEKDDDGNWVVDDDNKGNVIEYAKAWLEEKSGQSYDDLVNLYGAEKIQGYLSDILEVLGFTQDDIQTLTDEQQAKDQASSSYASDKEAEQEKQNIREQAKNYYNSSNSDQQTATEEELVEFSTKRLGDPEAIFKALVKGGSALDPDAGDQLLSNINSLSSDYDDDTINQALAVIQEEAADAEGGWIQYLNNNFDAFKKVLETISSTDDALGAAAKRLSTQSNASGQYKTIDEAREEIETAVDSALAAVDGYSGLPKTVQETIKQAMYSEYDTISDSLEDTATQMINNWGTSFGEAIKGVNVDDFDTSDENIQSALSKVAGYSATRREENNHGSSYYSTSSGVSELTDIMSLVGEVFGSDVSNLSNSQLQSLSNFIVDALEDGLSLSDIETYMKNYIDSGKEWTVNIEYDSDNYRRVIEGSGETLSTLTDLTYNKQTQGGSTITTEDATSDASAWQQATDAMGLAGEESVRLAKNALESYDTLQAAIDDGFLDREYLTLHEDALSKYAAEVGKTWDELSEEEQLALASEYKKAQNILSTYSLTNDKLQQMGVKQSELVNMTEDELTALSNGSYSYLKDKDSAINRFAGGTGADSDEDGFSDSAEDYVSTLTALGYTGSEIEQFTEHAIAMGDSMEEATQRAENLKAGIDSCAEGATDLASALVRIGYSSEEDEWDENGNLIKKGGVPGAAQLTAANFSSEDISSLNSLGLLDGSAESDDYLSRLMGEKGSIYSQYGHEATMEVVAYLDTNKIDEQMAMLKANPIEFLMQAKISNTKDLVSEVQSAVSSGAEIDPDTLQSLYELVPALKSINLYSEEGQEALSEMSDTLDNLELQSLIRIRDSLKADRDAALEAGENVDDLNEQLEDIETQIKVKIDLDTNIDDAISDVSELDSSLDDLVNSFDDDGFISTDKVTDLMDLCGSEWTQYLVGMKDDEIQLSQEGVDYVKNMAQEKLQAEIDAKKQEAQYNADYYNAVADAYALEAEQYQQAIDDKDETAERDAKIQAGLNQAIANADSELTNNKATLLTTDISNTDAATDQEANEYLALAGTTANVANNMIDSFNKVGEAGVNAATETNKAFKGEIANFISYKGSANASNVKKEDAKDSEKTVNDKTSSDGVGDVDTSSTESFEDKKQTALENESANRDLANMWNAFANSDYIYDSYAAGSSDDSSDSGSDSSTSDSDSDLDTEEYLEDEYDRYEKVNTAIEKLTNSLSQLQTEESRLIGIDKSKYLKKEIDSLQQQIALQKEKLALEQEELAEKADSLSEYGITFDGEGLIQNYKDVYYQLYDEYNALVDQYNATNDDATKTAMEAAKDRYDKYTQLVEDYDELLSSTIEDTKSELQDLADQIEDIYIQAFRDHLDAIENIKDISDTWADALAAMDSRDSDDVTLQHETNVRKTENQKVYLDSIGSDLSDMVNLWANKNSENFYDDVLGRYGEDSADAFEDYKTVFNDAAEAVQNFRDDIDQLHEDILDKMDEMDDEIEKRQEQYENINDTLQTYYDMYEQMHGDEAYEGLNQIIEAQQEVNAAQIENQKDVIAYYEKQRDMFEEGTEEWEQANDNCIEAQKTLADLVQTSLENQQKIYENNVNKILSDAQTSLLGTDLDWIQTEWELINQNADYYLDDVNKAYNIQKLQSEYLDLLDDATALDTQNQITEQMNQQLAYLREKTNLSSYDVSYAEAQLEILKQQIALEDAQANKSQLKLKRDSQGNYKYVYTANEGDVKTAQSSLLDATNNAYNISKDQVQQTQEDALSALQEAFSNIQSILTNVNLTVEEKKERIQKIIDNLKEYIAMTGEQLSTAQTNMLESFCQFAENLTDENSLDIQDIYQGIQDGSITTLDSVDAVYTSAITKMLENTELFTDTMDDAHDKWISNLEDYEDKTAQISSNIGTDIKDNVGGAIQETLGDLKELTDGEDEFNASLQKVNAELANWSETLTGYKAQIAELSGLLTEAYNKIKQLTGEQDEAAVGNSSANGGSGSGSSGSSGTIGSGSAVAGDGQAQVGDIATLKSGHYYVYSSDGSHYRTGNLFSGVTNGVKIDMTSNLQDPSHPIHIRSADEEYDDLGWVKLEDLEGFDTGGYTGEWNDGSGKLAMLHSKEIILNADDTQNILKAVESVRAMTSAMKGASLSDAIGSLSSFGRTVSTSAQSVDQNVHITAEFPAASSSEDIRQALLGLTNQALHYANQTI